MIRLVGSSLLLVLLWTATCQNLRACGTGIDDVVAELMPPKGLVVEPYFCEPVPGARSIAVSGADNNGAIVTYISTRRSKVNSDLMIFLCLP